MIDAPDIDVWVEAQQPPIYEQMQSMHAEDTALPARPSNSFAASSQSESDGKSEKLTDQLQNGAMRQNAIHEAAFSFAAQTALAWRYEQLRELTQAQEGTLDVIASFAPFVVDEHMLLPSITRVEDRFDVSSDGKQLRSTNIQYHVAEEPRAVTQPPTWRDYIWRDFAYPEKPHPALMPDSSKDQKVWQQGIEEGWESGLRQAHYSWTNNLNKLVRDIRGRIIYRILEARDVVRRPQMKAGQPRLTRSEDGTIINAGEVIHTITVPMSFNDQSQWGALWLPANDQAPQFEDLKSDRSLDNQPTFVRDPREAAPDEAGEQAATDSNSPFPRGGK